MPSVSNHGLFACDTFPAKKCKRNDAINSNSNFESLQIMQNFKEALKQPRQWWTDFDYPKLRASMDTRYSVCLDILLLAMVLTMEICTHSPHKIREKKGGKTGRRKRRKRWKELKIKIVFKCTVLIEF